MRYFCILVSMFLLSLLASCTCCIDGPKYGYCETEKDCTMSDYLSFYCGYSKDYSKKVCMINQCKDEEGNKRKLCGMGECIPCGRGDESCKDIRTQRGYACQCPEGTVLYDEHPDESYGEPVCVPKCDSNYTGVCEKASSGEFKDQIGYYIYCNLELGHCARYCSGEGSCPESYSCDDGFCRSKVVCQKNDDCSNDETYVCGSKGNCFYNPCWYYDYYCGAGKCKGGGDESQLIENNFEYGRTYTCECEDNTVLTDKGVCMLKCTKDETCYKFKLPDYPNKSFHCNEEKGHCEE